MGGPGEIPPLKSFNCDSYFPFREIIFFNARFLRYSNRLARRSRSGRRHIECRPTREQTRPKEKKQNTKLKNTTKTFHGQSAERTGPEPNSPTIKQPNPAAGATDPTKHTTQYNVYKTKQHRAGGYYRPRLPF